MVARVARTGGEGLGSGVANVPCPAGAIEVAAGASIEAAVERAGEGAAFCLKNGVHRIQVIRPKSGQSFHGEGQTVLSGSRLLTTFSREGRYWVAAGQKQRGRKHGQCAKEAPTCNFPQGLFLDDKPLDHAPTKHSVEPGRFYFYYPRGRTHFADAPPGRNVQPTVS